MLIKESYEWKKLEEGNNKSNKGNGWQSPETLMQKNTPGFKTFTDIIQTLTNNLNIQPTPTP